MACLDTTLLVDLLRRRRPRRSKAIRKLDELTRRGETLCTTRICVAELYVGVERADDPQREEHAVQTVLQRLEVLELDDRAARLFGQATAHLWQLGRPAGDMDVLIAATSMANGHILVTHDTAHFANIPGLAVESY